MEDILKAKQELDSKIENLVKEFIEEHKISYVGYVKGLIVRQAFDNGSSVIVGVNANVDTFLKIE